MTTFVTVVYAINDNAELQNTQKNIEKQIATFDANQKKPQGICAISNTNEIQRLELIENTLSSEVDAVSALDQIRKILALTNLPEAT